MNSIILQQRPPILLQNRHGKVGHEVSLWEKLTSEDILKDISDLRGHLAPPEQYELYASLCVLICGPPRHT